MNIYVTDLGVYEYAGTGRTVELVGKVDPVPCIVRVNPDHGKAPQRVTLPDGVFAPDPELDAYL